MSRILLTDAERFPFDASDRAAVAAAGHELVELEGHDPEAIASAGRDAGAVLIYHARMTAGLIGRLERCRVLARCGGGYDNIDVAAARAAGMEVVYVPDYGVDEVADHAMALLLACARRLAASDAALRGGRWLPYAQLGSMHRLRGRRLGLVGFGRIARAVAERARGFGLEIAAHDPHADPAPDALALGLAELLETSDYLSLHVPLTAATRHLIGRAELARVKPGAVLVNTGRGELVDEAALLAALEAGRLAGAGLDVYEHEPVTADNPLLRRADVVVTPHSAAFSDEALAEVRRRALADALRALDGERPKDPVPT